jgi:hypothetical protein
MLPLQTVLVMTSEWQFIDYEEAVVSDDCWAMIRYALEEEIH